MADLPTRVSTKIVHQNPWWQSKCDQFVCADGQVREYYYAETHGAVFIIPILPDGRIVLLTQYRYLEGRDSLELPGGGIKADHTPEAAARAELAEEIGAEAATLTKIGEFEPANGFVRDRSHIFVAQIAGLGENRPDATEVIHTRQAFMPSEIAALIADNTIWDGQTLATWALAVAKKHILC